MAVKAMSVPIKWLGSGCAEGKTEQAERPLRQGEPQRSHSPHSSDAADLRQGDLRRDDARGRASKTLPSQGRAGR
jgi:hypothetical protein